jgi:hypothetical protein
MSTCSLQPRCACFGHGRGCSIWSGRRAYQHRNQSSAGTFVAFQCKSPFALSKQILFEPEYSNYFKQFFCRFLVSLGQPAGPAHSSAASESVTVSGRASHGLAFVPGRTRDGWRALINVPALLFLFSHSAVPPTFNQASSSFTTRAVCLGRQRPGPASLAETCMPAFMFTLALLDAPPQFAAIHCMG